MRPLYRIVETDNLGGDYPDEKFLNVPECLHQSDAEHIANAINWVFCPTGGGRDPSAPRYWKVVEDGYKLVPGFEP
jgi:hypothetical protein